MLSHVTARLAARRRPSPTWHNKSAGRPARCSATARLSTVTGLTTLRRILRFRHAARLLSEGIPIEVAARAGYADQPHLHREVRDLAGVPLSSLRQELAAARTDPPSCRPGRRRWRSAGPTARRTRLQRSGMACRGDLLEQSVDFGGRTHAERAARAGWPSEDGGVQPGMHAGDGLLDVEGQRVSARQLDRDVRHLRFGYREAEQPVELQRSLQVVGEDLEHGRRQVV